jgi:hypothetical protein
MATAKRLLPEALAVDPGAKNADATAARDAAHGRALP